MDRAPADGFTVLNEPPEANRTKHSLWRVTNGFRVFDAKAQQFGRVYPSQLEAMQRLEELASRDGKRSVDFTLRDAQATAQTADWSPISLGGGDDRGKRARVVDQLEAFGRFIVKDRDAPHFIVDAEGEIWVWEPAANTARGPFSRERATEVAEALWSETFGDPRTREQDKLLAQIRLPPKQSGLFDGPRRAPPTFTAPTDVDLHVVSAAGNGFKVWLPPARFAVGVLGTQRPYPTQREALDAAASYALELSKPGPRERLLARLAQPTLDLGGSSLPAPGRLSRSRPAERLKTRTEASTPLFAERPKGTLLNDVRAPAAPVRVRYTVERDDDYPSRPYAIVDTREGVVIDRKPSREEARQIADMENAAMQRSYTRLPGATLPNDAHDTPVEWSTWEREGGAALVGRSTRGPALVFEIDAAPKGGLRLRERLDGRWHTRGRDANEHALKTAAAEVVKAATDRLVARARKARVVALEITESEHLQRQLTGAVTQAEHVALLVDGEVVPMASAASARKVVRRAARESIEERHSLSSPAAAAAVRFAGKVRTDVPVGAVFKSDRKWRVTGLAATLNRLYRGEVDASRAAFKAGAARVWVAPHGEEPARWRLAIPRAR